MKRTVAIAMVGVWSAFGACGDSGGGSDASVSDTGGQGSDARDTGGANLAPVPRAAAVREQQVRFYCECQKSQLTGFRLTVDECVTGNLGTGTDAQLTCISDWIASQPAAQTWLACHARVMEETLACYQTAGCGVLIPTFACANGTDRIDPDDVCDLDMDCPDGSDELNCTNYCDNDTYAWEPKERCDLDEDCADGADEADCTYLMCDGETNPASDICDGIEDCDDGSDEVGCPPSTDPCQNATVRRRAECGDTHTVLDFLNKTNECGFPYIRVPFL